MKNNRVEELDIMKFWGILLVVLGHVTRMYSSKGLIHPIIESHSLSVITNLIYSFHMPLFVFVSGCVFAFQCEVLKRKDGFLDMTKKKSKRLLIPYLVFGIFMVVLMYGLGLRTNFVNYAFDGILLSLDSRHLWYVLMLFIVFEVFWIMRKAVEVTHIPIWSLIIVSFVFYLLSGHISSCLLQINTTLKYLFWFTLGYIFLIKKSIIIKVLIYLTGVTILIYNMYKVSNIESSAPLLGTISACVGILLFYMISSDTKSITNFRLYRIISKNSFGIYLFHVFFVYLLFFFAKDIYIHPYLLCFVVFSISLLLSIIMTELTRRLGWHIIIGEKPANTK